MNIKEGLHFYEIGMLGCGVLLFLICLALLVLLAVKGKQLKQIYLFFVLSVFMIGWPSIKKFEYENLIVELDDASSRMKINNGVESPGAIEPEMSQLRNKVDSVNKRIDKEQSSAELLGKLARWQLMVGKGEDAIETAEAVSKRFPDSPRTQDLLERVGTARLREIIPPDSKQTKDPKVREEIRKTTELLNSHKELSAETRLEISKGFMAIGETKRARDSLSVAKSKNPQLKIDESLMPLVEK